MDTAPPAKNSDLGVRTLSAIVMLAVAGGALWLGGWWWTAFVVLVAIGVFWEWRQLAFAFAAGAWPRMIWGISGLFYIGLAASYLIAMRTPYDGIFSVSGLLLAVIGVDVGAYFAGRAIGGPKIAPSISPSKTWAGLFGGIIGAACLSFFGEWAWTAGLCQAYVDVLDASKPPLPPGVFSIDHRCHLAVPGPSWAWSYLLSGSLIAIVAQSGDFFQSWMKRRAGVKDSGNLIPGHGGLFDRVDGLLAVCFVLGVIFMISGL